MEDRNIYEDIALHGGDIYIEWWARCRTGKSTFIKRFMETLVIPHIDNVYRKERARDELPQSGSGRTIMTAEPKFVPEEAVEIAMDGGANLSGPSHRLRGLHGPGCGGTIRGRYAPDGHHALVRP